MFKTFCRVFLWIMGWEPEGERPEPAKFVLIAAPHTSNWDLIYLVTIAGAFGLKINWIGKHTIFKPPWGPLARLFGGLSLKRDSKQNMVEQMVEALTERDRLALIVPAEGTRGHVEHWRSGFYHIARLAQVPIIFGYLDYRRKRGGFGSGFIPTGDLSRDMDIVREFYSEITGKYPENFGRIRLKEEKAETPKAAGG